MNLKRNRKYLIESFQEQWTCPITSQPMIDPVSTMDGHSYEKKDITEWLKKQKTSPKTNLSLNTENVIPNIVLKSVISKFQSELKYEYEKICTQNQELNEKLQKFEEKAKQILKEKNKIQIDYKEMKNKYSELLNNSKKVADSFLQHKKDGQALRTQIYGLKDENKSLKADAKSVQILKSENKSLKQESQKLKKENQFYLIQNQSLIQQRIQSMNSKEAIKQELLASNKQKEDVKNILKAQINKYNLLLAKIDNHQKLKIEYDQTLLRYNNGQEQIEKLGKEIEKVKNEKKIAGQTIETQVKNNIRLKAQHDKLKAETKIMSIELTNLNQQIKKLNTQNLKLKNDYSDCLAQLISASSKIPKKQIVSLQKPQNIDEDKMDEEKPSFEVASNQVLFQNQQKNQFLFSFRPFKKIQDISKIQQDVRSRSQKSLGASDRLSQPLGKMKSAPTDVNSVTKFLFQNTSSMLHKIKENTSSLKNLFSSVSEGPKLNAVQLKSSHSSQIKPAPLERINSLPASKGFNIFHSLINNSVAQKIQKMEEKSKKIMHILPYSDYLMNNPVLYDEQNSELDHSGYKIDIEEFLKHDWSSLKKLNLSKFLVNKR